MNQAFSQKRQNWLKYSPFIYSYLSLHPIQGIDQISHLCWLRGLSRNKSSFKFNEGMLCIGGNRNFNQGNRRNKQGIITLYNTAIPKADNLDDDRLMPKFEPKSELVFQNSVKNMVQFSCTPNQMGNLQNNAFAVSFEEINQIFIVPINKLTEDSNFYSRKIDKQEKNIGILASHQRPISQIKWCKQKRGSQCLFSSSLDGRVYQWDLEKLQIERQMKFHRGPVIDIAVMHEPLRADKSDMWPLGPQIAENYTLASLGSDGDVFLWDSRSKNPALKINSKQNGQITSIACISDAALITGCSDRKLQFWDLRKKQKYQYDTKIDSKEGHKGKITNIQLNRQTTQTQAKNKAFGKINFTTTAVDGKIIQWQDKIQFIHEGHSSAIESSKNPNKQRQEEMKCCFDRQEGSNMYASASNVENVLMLWQPGVLLGNVQK